MRKKYLSSLENRTPKELAEEEALYVELKRIEQNEKRFKQDRDRLLRTLLGAECGLPDLPIDEDGPLGDPKKRKRGVPSELDSLATPSSSLFASVIPKRAQSAKSAAEGTHLLPPRPPPNPSPLFSVNRLFLYLTKRLRCVTVHPTHGWYHARRYHNQDLTSGGISPFLPRCVPQGGGHSKGHPNSQRARHFSV